MAKRVGAIAAPSSGDEQRMRLAEVLDAGLAVRVKARGGEDQDRGVDHQREEKRDGGIERGEADRLALLGHGRAIGARLHDRGVEVEIVRHDGRAENAEREIEHVRIGDDLRARHEAAEHARKFRPRENELRHEAEGDDRKQRDDERLDPAKALVLQIEDEEHVERGDDDAVFERDAEQ